MFETGLFDAPENAKDGYPLGESTRRHLVLPGSAPPRRLALRRADPTRPWYVLFLNGQMILVLGIFLKESKHFVKTVRSL